MTAAEALANGSARRLGNGFSLSLNTGAGTHLTLVNFNSCKRGFEQSLVKSMAAQYFQSRGITNIDLVLGEPHNKRSVKVGGAVLTIVKDLAQLFASFDIDTNQVPHIDLRGNDTSSLQLQNLSVVDNWTY